MFPFSGDSKHTVFNDDIEYNVNPYFNKSENTTIRSNEDKGVMQRVAEIAGETLIASSVLGPTVFFASPVLIPVTAAAITAVIAARASGVLEPIPRRDMLSGIFISMFASMTIGALAARVTYEPALNFVKENAKTASSYSMLSFGLGVTLWGASCLRCSKPEKVKKD